ncbi:L-threonylcarbamoyladenylate synthase [Janibacter limosus]|jgi:tRNA threonylcarbamoyl adenosine modification protein (Sua5/YciO/YrdC/YwlC family)|uniref:L-threonylcarbamoyladenylate synthase n=1 Tax=Janibacter limosus TaxID=53458 RepID=UPI000831C082|nr:L-threonylcarbamoyladenylate synthase [Janibacter limosus]
MATFVEVHPDNPQPRTVGQVVERVREGDLVAFPTDSGYALGGRLDDQAIKDRIRDIRQLDDKHHYTLLCADFAQLGQLVLIDNSIFRAIKSATPGPYTFILPATKEVPKRLLHAKKKTVGVRIPSHPLSRALLDGLGDPMLISTLILPGEDQTPTFGWDVKEALDHQVDIVVDAGEVSTEPTTVVDLSSGEAVIARYGAGDPAPFE